MAQNSQAKPVTNDATGDWAPNPHITRVDMTALEQRIAAERPELSAGLVKIREALGEEVYAKRIAGLVNLTISGETMLVVAPSFMERSLLERECIPAFKAAFGVKTVRVVV